MYEGDALRRNDFAENKPCPMSSEAQDASASIWRAIFANFGWAEKKRGDIVSRA
jgi:hypothetical protein